MTKDTLESIRNEYESSIIAQRIAFLIQAGPGDRAELASIATAATRTANDNRRKYEAAVYEHWKETNEELEF